MTAEGTILGTPSYMAPEQIEGKPADERSDIFAFGLVLYEMLTGQRAFEGESAAAVAAAILEREPTPASTLQPAMPPALVQVLSTCLAKDPGERWQSARELRHALTWASGPSALRRTGSRVGWIAAAVSSALAVAALGFAVAHRRPGKDEPRAIRIEIAPPEGATLGWSDIPAVSPDGERIAFSAFVDGNSHLFVRPLSSFALTRVPGSEGASGPFWSPDGRHLGFFTSASLKKADLSGGPVEVLCALAALPPLGTEIRFRTLRGGGASWNRTGRVVFSWRGRLFQVPASGGECSPLGGRVEGETARHWPHFLPDGQRYLYLSEAAQTHAGAIYAASLGSDERKWIVENAYNVAYSPSGHLLFVRGQVLMAQAFDARRLELSGEPFPVTDRVVLMSPPNQGAAYSISTNGVLAWQAGSSPERTQLAWFDRSGRKLRVLGEPADYSNPVLSPGDDRLAVGRRDAQTGTRDLWIFDVIRGTSRRLTFNPADDFGPVWSPDGAWIAFTSDRKGIRDIYRKRADGLGDDEVLLASKDSPKHVEDWSPDGKLLAYNFWPGGRPMDLFLLPLLPGGAGQPIPFVTGDSPEQRAQFAPGGRFIAYNSTESGRDEVYVQSVLPDGGRGPGTWQISTDGGLEPRWRHDGKELFYVSGSTIVAVEVDLLGSSFEAGAPKPLFEVRLAPEARRNRFVVTRDGQRFLVNTPVEGAGEPIRVLVNWLP